MFSLIPRGKGNLSQLAAPESNKTLLIIRVHRIIINHVRVAFLGYG